MLEIPPLKIELVGFKVHKASQIYKFITKYFTSLNRRYNTLLIMTKIKKIKQIFLKTKRIVIRNTCQQDQYFYLKEILFNMLR